MQGTYKPFNQSLFANNDLKSREVVKAYMKSMGFEFVDNTDKYGIDLISIDGSVKLEVEHRLNWNGERFPFSTVRLLERKKKFFTDTNNHFCILSENYSHLGLILGSKIVEYITPENFRLVNNRFIDGEGCYEVPASEFKWVALN